MARAGSVINRTTDSRRRHGNRNQGKRSRLVLTTDGEMDMGDEESGYDEFRTGRNEYYSHIENKNFLTFFKALLQMLQW